MSGGQTLPVSEVFGPTWQGEGRHAGRLCGFVRLGLCNLSCEWCDTPFTWDRTRYDVKAECPDRPWYDVGVELAGYERIDLWVLSGGEPLIHALPHADCALGKLMRSAANEPGGVEWHVETNGTLVPPTWMRDLVRHVTVSPKINTNDPEHRRLRPSALTWWAAQAWRDWADFKFVVSTPADLFTVDLVVDTYKVPPDRVWIMPEGTDADVLLSRHRELAPMIAARGWNTTTRLQSLLWADERGH